MHVWTALWPRNGAVNNARLTQTNEKTLFGGPDPGVFVAIKGYDGGTASQYLSFALLASFHQCCMLSIILALLLSEGQAGEAWEPSKKAGLLRQSGSIG